MRWRCERFVLAVRKVCVGGTKGLWWRWSRRPDKSSLDNERFVWAVGKVCVGGTKGLCWR